MDAINLIQDLAIVLLAAGAAGALCRRAGLSVVVGYLLAGIVIGPHTPPFSFILDIGRIETLSQIGLVFLMFAIGLGLSLTKLQKMGVATLIATGLGAFFVLNMTQLLGMVLGWTPIQSLFIAAMFMCSSSAVIAKVLKDLNLTHERAGQVALAITVQEDIVAVVMLAVLGSQATAGVGSLLAGLSAFVVLLVMAGLFFVPRLLHRVETKADPELQTIVVAGLLFIMSLVAVKAGYSIALGAFLLGAIVAEMPQRGGVERSFTGMRDMFSSVFFVSIGMMIDVKILAEVWPLVLGLTVFTLVVRTVATGFALILVGTPPYEARRAGLSLTPLGEFTFVIAQLGVSTAVLPPHYYPAAVGVSLLTVLLAPLISRHADSLLRIAEKAEHHSITRVLSLYHTWLEQLSNLHSSQLWWQLSKKRLLQILLEVLLVTGLLSFSGPLLEFFQNSAVAARLSPLNIKLIFFTLLGLLILIPLMAIWKNITVLAMILAELAETRTRISGAIVENGFKVLAFVVTSYWLVRVVPTEHLSRWSWFSIIAVLGVVLLIFSRRLVFLHSMWQGSLKEVFSANEESDIQHHRRWMQNSLGWDINIQAFIVPEHAVCSGSSIAGLRIRRRFGCSIVEIERQGHIIIAPEPAMALYPGDRLLLLGTSEQINTARVELSRIRSFQPSAEFDEVYLEAVVVPPSSRTGQTLAELRIPQHAGVQVVGIERDGEKMINPSGEERVMEGDELLVLGSPEQIQNFELWLADHSVHPILDELIDRAQETEGNA